MIKLEYEIRLNEAGRPFIFLPKDYNENPEDKFLAIELTRYLLTSIHNRKSHTMNPNDGKALEMTLDLLEKVSDEMAILMKEEMKVMGEVSLIFHRNYDIQVTSIEELNNLNYEGIIYNEKIFKREPGLKVLVLENMKIYKLENGIDNENWIEV